RRQEGVRGPEELNCRRVVSAHICGRRPVMSRLRIAPPTRRQGGNGVEADTRDGGTAHLVKAMLDAEAARQAAQATASQEILFADELLPGVGGEELTLKEGL